MFKKGPKQIYKHIDTAYPPMFASNRRELNSLCISYQCELSLLPSYAQQCAKKRFGMLGKKRDAAHAAEYRMLAELQLPTIGKLAI
jgi:hypothetical protein